MMYTSTTAQTAIVKGLGLILITAKITLSRITVLTTATSRITRAAPSRLSATKQARPFTKRQLDKIERLVGGGGIRPPMLWHGDKNKEI